MRVAKESCRTSDGEAGRVNNDLRKENAMNRKRLLVRSLVACGFAACFVTPTLASSLECRVVLQPDALRPATEPVSLQALLPGQVGDALRGRVEEKSGIEVLTVGTEDSGVTVVTLDTSSAVAGDWMIRFDAEDGTCGARLTIADGR